MRYIILVMILLITVVGCSNDNENVNNQEVNSNNANSEKNAEQEEVNEVNENNTESQKVSLDNDNEESDKGTEPINFDDAVEKWDEEISGWYTESSMGAINVEPIKEDYSHLHVTVHDNIQVLDEEGRVFIAEDMADDLQDMVEEIFGYEGEVQVDFEFQDGSPLVKDE